MISRNFASASIITNKEIPDVQNYVAKGDLVPFASRHYIKHRMGREDSSIIILNENTNFANHSFNCPAYREQLVKEGDVFIEKYGRIG